jgi:hypothetical protein
MGDFRNPRPPDGRLHNNVVRDHEGQTRIVLGAPPLKSDQGKLADLDAIGLMRMICLFHVFWAKCFLFKNNAKKEIPPRIRINIVCALCDSVAYTNPFAREIPVNVSPCEISQ